MLIKSKGNTVEIAPGVKFVENNHSRGVVYHLETIYHGQPYNSE